MQRPRKCECSKYNIYVHIYMCIRIFLVLQDISPAERSEQYPDTHYQSCMGNRIYIVFSVAFFFHHHSFLRAFDPVKGMQNAFSNAEKEKPPVLWRNPIYRSAFRVLSCPLSNETRPQIRGKTRLSARRALLQVTSHGIGTAETGNRQ